MAHHVSEQTEGERQNACQVADDFNDEDQWGHPPDRPQKVFDVGCTVVLDSDNVRKDHDHQGAGEGCIEVGGGRESGSNQRPSSPMVSTMNSSIPDTTSSIRFCSLPGIIWTPFPARKPTTIRKIINTQKGNHLR